MNSNSWMHTYRTVFTAIAALLLLMEAACGVAPHYQEASNFAGTPQLGYNPIPISDDCASAAIANPGPGDPGSGSQVSRPNRLRSRGLPWFRYPLPRLRLRV